MSEKQYPAAVAIGEISAVAKKTPFDAAKAERLTNQSKEARAGQLFGLYVDYQRIEASVHRAVMKDTRTDPKTGKHLGARATWDEYQQGRRSFHQERVKLQKSGQPPNKAETEAYHGAYRSMIGLKQKYRRELRAITPLVNPQAKGISKYIEVLWRDSQVQEVFHRVLRQRAAESTGKFAPDLFAYRQLKRQLSATREELFQSLSMKFCDGRMAPTYLQMQIVDLEAQVSQLEKSGKEVIQPAELTREKTDLAARAKYDDLLEYRRQLEKNFIWSPSRIKILRQIMTNVASGAWTMLKGEAGSGKTKLARSAINKLQHKPAVEASGREFSAAKGLVGSHSIEDKRDYWVFGTVTQGITGFANSIEMAKDLAARALGKAKRTAGSLIFIDEANLFPPGVLEGPLKAIDGRRPGEVFTMSDELPGVPLRAADEGTGLIIAVNPADARYDNRHEFPPSLDRLFQNGRIDVDYPKVSITETAGSEKQDIDAELFDMFLAALMTRDGRILLSPQQLVPYYQEITDRPANKVRRVISADADNMEKHGALYRFALLVTAVNDSFSNIPVTLPGEKSSMVDKMELSMLDMGKVMGWMRELEGHADVDLQSYLLQRLSHFTQGFGPQRLADFNVLKKIAKAYGFDLDATTTNRPLQKLGGQVLTQREIGYLSPEVPRPELRIGEQLGPQYEDVYYVDSAKSALRVDKNPQSINVNGHTMSLEKGNRCEVMGREMFYVGKDATTGMLVFSEDSEVLDKELATPEAAVAQLIANNKLTIFSPILPRGRRKP